MIQARIALTLALALLFWCPAGLAQEKAQREITSIKGDLYRFRNAGPFSVFLVTPVGHAIILLPLSKVQEKEPLGRGKN
jgi:hypothetical protein